MGGTHFNSCKRIHPLFAAALEGLHFLEFLESYSDADITIEELKAMLTGKNDEELRSLILNNNPPSIFQFFEAVNLQ
jgi:hypothetical protein